MREIKFRAWEVGRDQMIMPRDKRYHQHFMSFCGNIFLRTTESMSCFGGGDQLHWSMREKILMQYTGLKDKNGTEIYEGDILSYVDDSLRIGVVKYESHGFIIDWGKDCHMSKHILNLSDRFDVIGNIYENPELLGGE